MIGRIGNGPWQYIGAGPTTLLGRGELYLAVNDDQYADDSGSFTASVFQCGCRDDDVWSSIADMAGMTT